MRVCSPSTVVGGLAGTMPSSDGRAIAESAVEIDDERERASPTPRVTVMLLDCTQAITSFLTIWKKPKMTGT